MHRLMGAVAAAMLPGLAGADTAWWHGSWTEKPAGCAAQDRVIFSEYEVTGYRNGCAVTFVQSARGQDGVRLTLACNDQGDHYEEEHMVLKDGADAIRMQPEDGDWLFLVRCE
ncbi:hypothetical protein RXV86_06865 [Alisedimentitalea sp. MJ-SS2]|uniref:hypothetical protein n=1 Tax=Aliisedimentitalea sp. MJ-SS2 TaxID=3049795 RepID=UPI00290E2CCC|nr:hypothetical protein [Alisedimentitalea sp. MJ-SS2]MDU8927100.1 hypothetical protein [Alisedimentitalea sp. MJ-SS2]